MCGKSAKNWEFDFLIEGSVRKAGDRLRVNAQLIDAVSGNHLWAERWGSTRWRYF